MKKLMILGGLLGFSIGIVFGVVQGSAWPSIVWKACAATLGAGLLVRWWGGVWTRSLRESFEQRANEAAAAIPATVATPKH